jgi:hypothetical protein
MSSVQSSGCWGFPFCFLEGKLQLFSLVVLLGVDQSWASCDPWCTRFGGAPWTLSYGCPVNMSHCDTPSASPVSGRSEFCSVPLIPFGRKWRQKTRGKVFGQVNHKKECYRIVTEMLFSLNRPRYEYSHPSGPRGSISPELHRC